ncbi:MAG: hypothetical protein GX556_03560 [Fibrobacter sp.]|nr:hypothetical protein [Fibrobacter sp.]
MKTYDRREMSYLFRCCLIILSSLVCFCAYTYNQGGSYSNEIRYKEADSTTNQIAYDKIMKVFSSNETGDSLFSKAVGCYPFLWSQIKNNSTFSNAKGPALYLNVGNGQVLTGKALQGKEVLDSLQRFLVEQIRNDGNEYRVRKLNEEELRIYWNLIPFDIEEPLYIVDSKSYKLILHFTGENVFQIENISNSISIKPVPLDTVIDQLPDLNEKK